MSKESVLDLVFAGGLDESQREELLDPAASFTVMENGRYPSIGGYAKRDGFAERSAVRSDGTTRTAGYRLVSYNGIPCVIDGHQLDTWSLAASQDIPRSRVPECTATRRPIVSRQALLSPFGTTDRGDVTSAVQNDVALAGGYYVTVFQEQIDATHEQLTCVVTDQTTGATVATMLVTGSNATTGPSNVQIIAVGTDVVVIWDSGTNVKASRLSVASQATIQAGFAAAVNLATDLGGNFNLAACGLTTKGVVIYNNMSAGTNRVTVKSFDPTTNALTILQTQALTTLSGSVTNVAVDGDEADTLWVAWVLGTVVHAEAHSPANISTVTGTAATLFTVTSDIRLVIGVTGTAQATLAVAAPDGTNTGFFVLHTVGISITAGAAGTAPNTTNTIYGFIACSKPFAVGGRIYLEAFHDDAASTAAVLLDITSATSGGVRPVAWAAPRLISMSTSLVAPRHVVKVSATKFATLQCIATNAVSGGLSVIEWDFADARRWRPAVAAGCLLLGGGMPSVFDGHAINEMAFVVPPRVRVATTAGALTGTFEYTAIYEYIDAKGNVVWSEPAPAQTIAPSGQAVSVWVRTMSATWKAGKDSGVLTPAGLRNVRIKVYRTANGGGLFYLVKSIINDPASAFITFTDTTTDAALIANAQPYRSPGVNGTAQPRQCPPCIFDWCSYNGMIVGITDDSIWWSGQHVAGEAIWFTDDFQQPHEGSEKPVAIAAQDGTCFVWDRISIYAMSGEAPSDNGSSGGLGTPRRLASDVGCINPDSVVVTSLGIFFQSERGIELLTRAQSIADPPIGRPVEKTTAAFPICMRATLDAAHGVVLFEMASSVVNGVATGTGRTLVFDLRIRKWISTDRRYSFAGTADAPAQSGAIIYDGTAYRYAWLGADGTVYVTRASDDASRCLDPGSRFVKKRAISSWIHSASLQGEQSIDRTLLLADFETAHDMTFTVEFDYNPASASAKPFTAAQLAAIVANGKMWVDREVDPSTNTAIRVTVEDATPSSGVVGTGEGATWIGLAFPGIPHRGVKRTSAAQRGG